MRARTITWHAPRNHWRKRLICLLLELVIILAGCNDQADQKPLENPPQIDGDRITFPKASNIPKTLSVITIQTNTQRLLAIPGRLAWDEDQTVRMFSPFNGRVTKILVNIGQQVQAGQALAMIQSPDFGRVESEYHKAVSDMEFAKKQLARVQELHQHGVSSRKALEGAETDYARAQADLERARARLQPYGDLTPLTGQFYLKTPLSGIIVQKAINPGQELNLGQASTPLFVITNPTTLWAQLEASEADLTELSLGETFSLISHAYPKERFSGVITHISDYVDPITRTIKVLAEVPNPQRKLKSEMFITAEIPIHAKSQPLVPTKAVILHNDNFYVFTSEGGGVYVRRQVRIGPEEQGTAPVLSGLSTGERVVSEGVIYLNQLLQSAHRSP